MEGRFFPITTALVGTTASETGHFKSISSLIHFRTDTPRPTGNSESGTGHLSDKVSGGRGLVHTALPKLTK